MNEFYLLIVTAYFCGSIPFGKIIGKLYGVDIQKKGSGNIGFANVVRSLGWKAGIPVLAGDTIKGFLPVFVAMQYADINDTKILAVAFVAIIGHIFPVWLKFKGGKGIATGLGVTLAINPALGLLGVATYITALALFKKSALSSIVAAWSLPLYSLLVLPRSFSLFYFGLAILALWTHRHNIKQMLHKS